VKGRSDCCLPASLVKIDVLLYFVVLLTWWFLLLIDLIEFALDFVVGRNFDLESGLELGLEVVF